MQIWMGRQIGLESVLKEVSGPLCTEKGICIREPEKRWQVRHILMVPLALPMWEAKTGVGRKPSCWLVVIYGGPASRGIPGSPIHQLSPS